ncbi:helix-turn-helix domain-containing protein [Salipaludibacillus sp. CUR1]|uniref:helix-turn-helix domain-containing protein n=1 Tax=Salipaludibacillus sp. CUR1 TaxID=2820003 RepID=UPI001E355F2C|nr:helix-turn-helix domain-containing protein [Salipaludibacillus sp. CUR1]MCE7793444.1 helix-turn-helix domain-containing protein [Salipaludibacillus sp. CUR1]
MEYSRKHLGKIAVTLDAQSCKLIMFMLSIANEETGYIDTSLTHLHEKIGTAKTTISRSIKHLQEAGYLDIHHEVGVKTHYYLRNPDEKNL